jgi:hypothetical protein
MIRVTSKQYWITIFHSIFYRNHRLAWDKLFAFGAALLCFLPKVIVIQTAHGVDASWIMAVNYMVAHNINFGNSFVFTYGPLGYLLTGLGIWVPVWHIILFRAFLFFSSMAMTLRMIRAIDNWMESIWLVLVFFMAVQFGMGEGGIVILLLIIFLGLEVLQKNKWPIWLLMVLLSVLVFFIKINTGFIGILLLGGFAFIAWRQQQLSLVQAVLLLLSALLFIVMLSYPLRVSIVPYMVNGMQIISGFQDTMGLDSWYAFTDFYAIAIMLMVAFMLFRLWRGLPFKKLEGLLLVTMLFGFFILLHKQGFIRADTHQFIFFGLAPLAFGLIISYPFSSKMRLQGKQVLLFIFLFCGFGIHQIGFNTFQLRPKWNVDGSSLPNNLIPDTSGVVTKVKNATVDVFPFEISYLLAAGLNYQPRPVPQGYSAYTPKLDALNAAHMLSEKAPEYLFYSNHSIVFRNAGWDETQTKIAMLSRYEVKDTFYILEPTGKERTDTFLLLQKRQYPLNILTDTLAQFPASINQPITIPASDGVVLMYVAMEYSLMNQLKKLWLKPKFPMAEITYANGVTESFHAPLPILSGGVMVQSRVSMQDDGLDLFAGKYPPENKVVSIRLLGNKGDYQSEFNVSFVNVKLQE